MADRPVMGPRELLARLRRLANTKRLTFEVREGRGHTLVWVNGRSTAIPRHGELGKGLLRKIVETDLALSLDDVRNA